MQDDVVVGNQDQGRAGLLSYLGYHDPSPGGGDHSRMTNQRAESGPKRPEGKGK